MFSSVKQDQLKNYYLFMLADGKCTEDERTKFSSICSALEVDTDTRKEVVDFCESAVQVYGNDNAAQIIGEIEKVLSGSSSFFLFDSLNKNKAKQHETIWTLINLGYADVEYSDAEKKVVSFLAEYWKMDNAVMADLLDTAETILALTMQKSWVKTINKPYDVVSASIAELDEAITRMADNVKILITESDMV